jgi:hypothetical protein
MPDPIKKKIKDNPSGETKWTTKGGAYITTEEANIWFQLTKFAPQLPVQTHIQSRLQCKERIL